MRIQIEPTTVGISIEVAGELRRGDLEIIDGADHEASARVRIEILGTGILLRTPTQPSGLADVTLLYVEETGCLFLGATRTSCVVDLARAAIEHRFEHCLFWGFNRTTRPGWILETGELDCLFRALDGRVVAQVPVDPPWESTVEPQGVRFQSDVHGTTFLPFPDTDG